MKRKLAVLGLVITILTGLGVSDRALASTEVTLDVFYDALAPYGEWIEHDYYGYIWQPVGVEEDWKPYSDGNWVYSDEGWIWVSNEPWGWATYHYGRWVPDEYYGWIWIPGVTWAPEYVTWYESPGYIGWSPRPPDTSFFLEIGITIGSGYGYYKPYYYDDYYYEPYYYGGHKHHGKHYGRHYRKHHYDYHAAASHGVYVPDHQFSHKNAKLVAVQRPHNLVVHRNSKSITNVKVENNRIVNHGPDRHSIERRTKKKINRVKIVERDLTHVKGRRDVNVLRGREYNVYRPKVVKKGDESPRRISKRSVRNDNSRGDNIKGDNIKGDNIRGDGIRSDKRRVINTPGKGRIGESSSSRGPDKSTNTSNLRTDYKRTRTYKSGADGKYTEVRKDERKNPGVEKRNNSSHTDRGTSRIGKESREVRANGNKQKPERTRNSHLSPAKSYKTHTTRHNNVSTNRQSSPERARIENSANNTNRVKGNASRSRYKSNSQRNMRGKSVRRETPGNVRKSSRNKVKSKPANTTNNSNRQVRSYDRSGTHKSQPRPINNGRQYQKSSSSNRAQKNVNSRSVNKGSSVRSAPNRSFTSSPVNRSYKSRSGPIRQSGQRSFNRQARR